MFIIELDANAEDDREFYRASAMARSLEELRRITRHDGAVRSIPKSSTDQLVGRVKLRNTRTGLEEEGTIYEVRG
jgi:hypothetical protein